ncbi:cupin domain-containing protein [Halopiger djelfimassiliensis]|uniref:cupin domain-containing protein n=1 Tax=Halopiger djelfimassiliensis TaxID=1293047 RepID=UPI0006777943|nr:cupin domain-containing protein [Halopiger djelfimassiliensis]
MERISIDDVDPEPYDDELHSDRRDLGDALGAAHVAVVRYALGPGERLSGAVHAHADQEELFVVLEGTATFETGDGEITVDEDEAIRFAPGEFQSGWNDANGRLVVLALGAPRGSDDVRVTRIPVLDDRTVACPECDHDHMRIADGSGLVCPDCGATTTVE